LTQEQAESDVQNRDDPDNGQSKIKNQPLRLKPGLFLLFKKSIGYGLVRACLARGLCFLIGD
jgi:hypothetical protein